MAADHKFNIIALFTGKSAMRGINAFSAKVKTRLAGLAKATQRFAGIGKAGRPSGVGGIFAGLLQGATSVLLLPLKVIGAFTKLIPGIGGIVRGVVSSAANVLQGLVGIATNVVGGIINAFGAMLKGIVRIFQKLVGAASSAFGKIAKFATYAGGAFATLQTLALRSFAAIEQKWGEVRTIMDMPEGLALKTREAVRDLADEMGIKAVAAIEAFYQAASQGFDTASAGLRVLRESAKIAIATVSDLPQTLATVTGVLNAYKLGVEAASDVGDIFFIGIRRGKMRMTELASGLSQTVGVAAMAKIKIEELVSFFAVGTQRAQLPIQMLSTGLRGLVTSLLRPMEQSAEALRRFGLTFKDLQRMGLMAYLERLQRVTGGDPELLAQFFPQRRALIGGILPMIQYRKEFAALMGEMGKRGGEVEGAWARMMDMLTVKWLQFWGALKRSAETFVEPLVGPMKLSLEGLTKRLIDMRPTIKKWGEAYAEQVGRVRAKLDGLLKWMETRDWSQAWAGMLSFPERMWEPTITAAVAGFNVLAVKLRALFAELWNGVVNDFRQTLARGIGGIARDIEERARGIEAAAIENVAKRTARYVEWKGAYRPEWEDLTEEKREQYRERAGVHPSAEILAAQAKAATLRATGRGLYGVAGAVAGVSATDAQIQQAALDAQRDTTQALEEFSLALAEAKRVGAETLPSKPPEQIAAEREGRQEEARRARVQETPEYKKLSAKIAQKEKFFRWAQETGALEAVQRLHLKLMELEDERAALLAATVEKLDEQAGQIGVQATQLSRLKDQVRRIRTARA